MFVEKTELQPALPQDHEPPIRPSKSGYTLLSLVLEQLVLPKLPQPATTSGKRATPAAKLASAMSIGTGYLFEKELVPYLQTLYPTYTLVEQPKLEWQAFRGTADYLLVDLERKHAFVVDAKAFRASTLREIKDRKLTDNWSYPTQLALYHMAAQEQLGKDVQVDSFWYIWSVPSAKLFVVEQPFNVSEKLAKKAQRRLDLYAAVSEALAQGDFKKASEIACAQPSECLLPKGLFFGNLCASTRFHYNAYCDLFYPEAEEEDNEGLPLEGEQLRLLVERLMRDSCEPNADLTYYRDYLLTKGYELD
jgi:hypothetical protein